MARAPFSLNMSQRRSLQSRRFGASLPVSLGVISVLALAGCSSAADDGGTAAAGSTAGAGMVLQGGAGSVAGSPSATLGGAGGSAGTPSAAGAGALGGAGSAGSAAGGTAGASTGLGGAGSAGAAGSGNKPPTCVAGLPSSLGDLAAMAGDSTDSKMTIMGTRYEGPAAHVMTSDDTAFFHDATKQPPIPGSTSGLHLKALPVTLYPSGGGTPTPADINQHAIGNCDGDTAFASMAYLNPAFIKSLITDNHNDTYSVAMYDPLAKRISITVDNQFLVDDGGTIGAVSGKNNVADWATVLEKATMKYVKVFPVVDDIGGISSEHQTPMFTGVGGSIAFDRGKLSPANLTRVVKAALAAGKIISGGFGIEGLALPSGLQTVTAHGYAVFVPKDGNTMISMRNPWGLDPTSNGYNASTDGVLDIPPDQTWAGTIDLRIIDPGDACGAGMTTPYLPLSGDISTKSLHVTEPHAR